MQKVVKSISKNSPTVLVILDGLGVAEQSIANPITPKIAPNYFSWIKKYPYTEIKASGSAVGLPKHQSGNSEAGHLNLGAGRIVRQDVLYVTDTIKDGTFFKNTAFLQAIHHLKKYKTSAHVMGLLSNHESAHSCPEHLYATLELLRREGIKKVYIHLFTDGRDSGQHDALSHLKKLRDKMTNGEEIATIMGRFYAMDRGQTWDRIKLAYDAIVLGKSIYCNIKSGKKTDCNDNYQAATAEEAISKAYNRGETDEFITPTIISKNGDSVAKVKDDDAIFFFNLRSDRARELTKVFVQSDFTKVNPGSFKRNKFPKNTRFVAMTDFGPDLKGVLTAFPSHDVLKSLPSLLCPDKQLYISETEKFAHVTYFFNGGFSALSCGEKRIKIDSVDVNNYKDCPKMSAKKITDTLISEMTKNNYKFICVNYANLDMVSHSGDFKATEKAAMVIDKEVSRLIKEVCKINGKLLITADHGNAEGLLNLKTGEVDTKHSSNLVPLFIIGKRYTKNKIKLRKGGKLSDVAPTLLKMMNIEKPKEMTGKSLF